MFQADPSQTARTIYAYGQCQTQITLPAGVRHTPEPCPNCQLPFAVVQQPRGIGACKIHSGNPLVPVP